MIIRYFMFSRVFCFFYGEPNQKKTMFEIFSFERIKKTKPKLKNLNQNNGRAIVLRFYSWKPQNINHTIVLRFYP